MKFMFQPFIFQGRCKFPRGASFTTAVAFHGETAAVGAEALSALDTFLELPKGGWPKKLKLPKRNVHSKNHECQDEMMKDRSLVFFFQ